MTPLSVSILPKRVDFPFYTVHVKTEYGKATAYARSYRKAKRMVRRLAADLHEFSG